jgi:hypothetical protein
MERLVIVAIAIVISTAAVAGDGAPAMTIGSSETTLSLEDCKAKASRILRNNSFTENFEILNKTVYGELGEYTAAIRCESTIAVFVVGGRLSAKTKPYHDKLRADFGT